MKLEQLSQYGVLQRPRVPEDERAPARPFQPAPGKTGAALAVEHQAGPATELTTHFLRSHRHGLHHLRELVDMSGNSFALVCRDDELAYLDFSQTVFLDTETTGLGTGAGTYVFLVGAGFLQAGHFQIKQFFLRGPHHEERFLDELERFLSRFSAVVTFNGKAFDCPLLENRFVLHRRRPPFDTALHVDLLFPARRLWKRRLESCALSSLERHILGVGRTQEDVPGYLIPQLYFQYQLTGDGQLLEGVFYHNLQDVLSLATLAVHIDHLVSDPSCGLARDGIDLYSLARTYERAGATEKALGCYEQALALLPRGAHRQECLIRIALQQKRERRWDSVLQTWYQLLDEGGNGALLARVELAKYFEHVERDYLQAIDHVQHALGLTELYGESTVDASRRDLERRLSRLVNRSIRAHSWVRGRGS